MKERRRERRKGRKEKRERGRKEGGEKRRKQRKERGKEERMKGRSVHHGPVVKTSSSNAGGVGLIRGQGAKILHAS